MVAKYHTPPYCQWVARLSAHDWVAAAIEQTAKSGAHSVRIEKLAKDLGVSKGSFYWHFKDRGALLSAMLEHWEAQGTAAIIEGVNRRADDPRTRLEELVELIFVSTPIELAFEIQVRAWGAADPKVAQVVHKIDRSRIAYVQQLLALAKVPYARARAELLYSILLGDMLRQTYGTQAIDRIQLRLLKADLLNL